MKKKEIDNFKKLLSSTPCEIVRRLADAGYEAYIVGGAIRDILLGETPKDYDITTSATPEQVRAVFGRRHCIVIGRRFKLALVMMNGDQYEVSTFRKAPTLAEGQDASSGPIWNDNNFGTQEDDAYRRDFTVNSIYFDVIGDRGFIDLCGGITDIKKRVVRCIGEPDIRFTEDPVRMLRALKLCGQFGFKLSFAVKRSLARNLEKIQLASPSRLFEELLKILISSKSLSILEALQKYGLLKYFWPIPSDSWDEDEGVWLRQIFAARCESLKNDDKYPRSKGLALATACFAFQMSAMSPGQQPRLWDKSPNANDITNKVIKLVFSGFTLPKVFVQRINTIMNLVPRLTRRPVSQRAMRNIEFFNALTLADTVAQVFGWEKDGLDLLHRPQSEIRKRMLPLQPAHATEQNGKNGDSAQNQPTKRRRQRKNRARQQKDTPSLP